MNHDRELPWLAGPERQPAGQLEQVAEPVGWWLTLEGLAPAGGEPQWWVVRERLRGMTLGWGGMSQPAQTAFRNFLRPIAALGWRVRAVLSDKPSGLLAAVAEVFPHVPQALCQMHDLQKVALPLAAADEALKVRVRPEIRESLGGGIRQAQEQPPGVLTVTGRLSSQVEGPPPALQSPTAENPTRVRDALVQDRCRRIRYRLTLKARPPFRRAGLERVAGRREVAPGLERLMAQPARPA